MASAALTTFMTRCARRGITVRFTPKTPEQLSKRKAVNFRLRCEMRGITVRAPAPVDMREIDSRVAKHIEDFLETLADIKDACDRVLAAADDDVVVEDLVVDERSMVEIAC